MYIFTDNIPMIIFSKFIYICKKGQLNAKSIKYDRNVFY